MRQFPPSVVIPPDTMRMKALDRGLAANPGKADVFNAMAQHPMAQHRRMPRPQNTFDAGVGGHRRP